MKKNGILQHAARPLLFGHRGVSAQAPENTLAAFALAMEQGIPGVELDVQRCRSGELIVAHDYDLARVTGEDAVIERTDYGNIHRLDAGSWFHPRFADQRIPRLRDVFDLCGNRLYYDIEIKHRYTRPTELESRLLNLIYSYGLKEHCIISSFNPFALRFVRQLDADIPTAIIYSKDKEVPALLRRGQGRFISRAGVSKPHHSLVKRRSRRFLVPWTVNDPVEAKRLVDLGVKGLISDDPARLLPVVRHEAARSS
jgi:glycerophosphoryl diester phosphodiesterase